MPTQYEFEHSSPLIDLLEWKLQRYFERQGFRVMLEYAQREGPDIIQLQRGNEIVSIYVHTLSDAEERLVIESSADGPKALISEAIRELVQECIQTLLRPISDVSEGELRQASDQLLLALWQGVGVPPLGGGRE